MLFMKSRLGFDLGICLDQVQPLPRCSAKFLLMPAWCCNSVVCLRDKVEDHSAGFFLSVINKPPCSLRIARSGSRHDDQAFEQ